MTPFDAPAFPEGPPVAAPAASRAALPRPAPLDDSLGRTVRYLRLSVTDRCDLRCVYCMPERMTFLPRREVLTLEELERVAGVFHRPGRPQAAADGRRAPGAQGRAAPVRAAGRPAGRPTRRRRPGRADPDHQRHPPAGVRPGPGGGGRAARQRLHGQPGPRHLPPPDPRRRPRRRAGRDRGGAGGGPAGEGQRRGAGPRQPRRALSHDRLGPRARAGPDLHRGHAAGRLRGRRGRRDRERPQRPAPVAPGGARRAGRRLDADPAGDLHRRPGALAPRGGDGRATRPDHAAEPQLLRHLQPGAGDGHGRAPHLPRPRRRHRPAHAAPRRRERRRARGAGARGGPGQAAQPRLPASVPARPPPRRAT